MLLRFYIVVFSGGNSAALSSGDQLVDREPYEEKNIRSFSGTRPYALVSRKQLHRANREFAGVREGGFSVRS